MNTHFSPLQLIVDDTDCPVCGLGAAFPRARDFDTCARCGWVDDPDAYADPARCVDTNEASLEASIRAWPAVLAARLAIGPLSSLEIVRTGDEFDYVIDGQPIGTFFGSARELRCTLGWWSTARDAFAPLLFGEPSVRGRIRLYDCPLCGDDLEPALSADYSESAGRIVWSRIGLEDYDFDNDIRQLNARSSRAGFAFDAIAYRRTFTQLQAELTNRGG